MKFEFNPRGVCSRHYEFEMDGTIIKDVKILGGCNGNLKGISSLIRGMDARDVIAKLQGIDCGGKGTSCPDQISRALSQYLETL